MINERLAHSVTLIGPRRRNFRKSQWWEDKNPPDWLQKLQDGMSLKYCLILFTISLRGERRGGEILLTLIWWLWSQSQLTSQVLLLSVGGGGTRYKNPARLTNTHSKVGITNLSQIFFQLKQEGPFSSAAASLRWGLRSQVSGLRS